MKRRKKMKRRKRRGQRETGIRKGRSTRSHNVGHFYEI
jgi:hypothetical protein